VSAGISQRPKGGNNASIVIEVTLDYTLILFSRLFAGIEGIAYLQVLLTLEFPVPAYEGVLDRIPQLAQAGT
jgi:hypothetical protein